MFYTTIVVYVALCLIWYYLAYTMYSVDANGVPVHDGLGRQLYTAPPFFQLVGVGEHWPGFKWFLGENLVFWTVNGLLAFWYSTSHRKSLPF